MKQKGIVWCLVLCALLSLSVPAYADRVRIELDGQRLADRGESTVIDGRIWVPLWEMALTLGMDSSTWEAETETLTIEAPELTIRARVGDWWMDANGVLLCAPGGVQEATSGVLVPLDAVCRAYGVRYSRPSPSRAELHAGYDPIQPEDIPFTEDDLYWLSRIVYAEAGGESFACQLAVAEVVLNRLYCDWYPDTIYGVIFDHENGIQFTPTINGSVYNNPTQEATTAARLALAGSDYMDDDVLFFVSALMGENWVASARTFVMQIGITDFYA